MTHTLLLILLCACFSWVFTVHTYIQKAVKSIPEYPILLPVKKVLSCTRCFSFNFTLVALFNANHIFVSIGYASVACVIACLIHNQFKTTTNV